MCDFFKPKSIYQDKEYHHYDEDTHTSPIEESCVVENIGISYSGGCIDMGCALDNSRLQISACSEKPAIDIIMNDRHAKNLNGTR